MTASDHAHTRSSIKSFVLRTGRMTAAQLRALEDLWPKYGLEPADSRFDLEAIFGRQAPCTVEIGFGDGELLVTLAAAHPERDFLGFEVHTPGVGHCLLRAAQLELTNLRVARGTLSDEERYKINEHIIQTIRMLESLPFPAHLQDVPDIAGGHHERLDGRGYPRGLTAEQLSPLARMMAIADVFEALTAVDRPYKSGKPLSVALEIMARMVREQHLDPDLFELFLRAGVYSRYAEEYLARDQCDQVDEAELLAASKSGNG